MKEVIFVETFCYELFPVLVDEHLDGEWDLAVADKRVVLNKKNKCCFKY